MKTFKSFINETTTLKTKEDVQRWLDEMEIQNYTISSNLIVNVKGDVSLINKQLTTIPVQFGVVNGDFIISMNKLTSLKGSPTKVGGSFYCTDNKLENLEYSPRIVGGDFYCTFNHLKTLKGAPEKVGWSFNYYGNPDIKDEKLTTKVNGQINGNTEDD
jgi:hypothetical protein